MAPKLVADLLGVIGDMAPESLGLDTVSFRQKLSQTAEQVTRHPEALTATMAAECVDLCYGFLRHAQAHLAEREREFSELIAVLSEMVATLGGGASFNDQLDRSAERLHKIVDINDIRILKRRLMVEIETLKKLSADKREQDSATRPTSPPRSSACRCAWRSRWKKPRSISSRVSPTVDASSAPRNSGFGRIAPADIRSSWPLST